jgi:hypothetical protein
MKIGVGVVLKIMVVGSLYYDSKSMPSVGYLNLLIPQFSFYVVFLFLVIKYIW